MTDGAAGGVTVLAHGVGGRGDLPVPFSTALVGAAVALLVSFAILAWAWRTPRFEDADAGWVLPERLTRLVDSAAFRLALQILGLLTTAYVLVAALFGPDLLVNPTFGVVYVLFWVGLVPLSVAFGPVWRLVNPLRTLHRLVSWLLRTRPEDGLLPLPAGLGYWPAAVGLFGFVWLELIAPSNTTLPVVRMWFAVYAVLSLMAAVIYGSRWFDRGDPFEVYSKLFGHLSPLARRAADGRLVLRNPLGHLARLPGSGAAAPGLVAVISVLLGSTAYDGFSQSTSWVRFVQGSGVPEVLAGTTALTCLILLVAGTFWTGTIVAGGMAGVRGGSGLPQAFAPSVMPIALGYMIAHYFTLLVLEGQRTLIQLSDPLSNGANLLGLSGRGVDSTLANSPELVALVKVGAVVVGHVFGVIAAHDRAAALFPRRTALLGQLPLLVVMVGYTLGGLTLLFAT
ncbi:hypothetical protein [Actinopolymorpha alba]|uniref:hypothetical protein n=1 Tax=Actinopolymorpha alba TaxID=533267 RepID=UPI00037C0FAE|nr:hypothetical protein [Actinopolymorpha alba]